MKDLTNSQIERRNVLNNDLAVRGICEQVGDFVLFGNVLVFAP